MFFILHNFEEVTKKDVELPAVVVGPSNDEQSLDFNFQEFRKLQYSEPNIPVIHLLYTSGVCTTQDLDVIMSHMNNARYLREIDFSRFHYFIRTKVYSSLKKMGVKSVLGASCTRYRRSIPFFMMYKITTKLIYWDEKSFYFEHKFINVRDNFIHTIILSKQTTIGMKMSLNEFLKELEPEICLPEINDDLRLWLESMQYSSQKLKKKD
ncbi:hypothetical protein HZH68_005217 [Vespula germanica]|uniref:Protein THEM6 n=1 Tax=Vespula germanica TaxID=30212 RepID=A0A834KFP3_VESGE|nr:hypothetical protein HZH68_005217 [Vespula germanica]